MIATPQQSRSRASTERVLNAVLELTAENGLDQLTVGAVASRAGVSVGTIYGRFGDKDSLVLAAQEVFLDGIGQDVGARLAALWTPTPPADAALLVRRVIALAVDVFRDHQTLIAQFIIRSRSVPALAERAEQTMATLSAQLVRAGVEHSRRFAHPDPALAVDVVFRVVVSALERRAASGPAFLSSDELSWAALADQLAMLAVGYLGLSSASHHP